MLLIYATHHNLLPSRTTHCYYVDLPQQILLVIIPGDSQHGISGDVYVVDNSTLYIADFNYDGNGCSATFYGGEEEDISKGVKISYPYQRSIGILGVR